MDPLEDIRKDVELIARLSTRVNDTLSRTTFSGCRSKCDWDKRLVKIKEDAQSIKHEMVELCDEFFSWHNELIRLARLSM